MRFIAIALSAFVAVFSAVPAFAQESREVVVLLNRVAAALDTIESFSVSRELPRLCYREDIPENKAAQVRGLCAEVKSFVQEPTTTGKNICINTRNFLRGQSALSWAVLSPSEKAERIRYVDICEESARYLRDFKQQ